MKRSGGLVYNPRTKRWAIAPPMTFNDFMYWFHKDIEDQIALFIETDDIALLQTNLECRLFSLFDYYQDTHGRKRLGDDGNVDEWHSAEMHKAEAEYWEWRRQHPEDPRAQLEKRRLRLESFLKMNAPDFLIKNEIYLIGRIEKELPDDQKKPAS
jgi:hypothetical protein